MRIKLEDAVRQKKTLSVEVRPALHADKCDACGKVFHMKPYCNDERLGELVGTFDVVPPKLGNIFIANVCSFACAHEVFANDGWKKIERYKPYVRVKARLVRAELKITSFVLGEDEIRKEWEKTKTRGGPIAGLTGIAVD